MGDSPRGREREMSRVRLRRPSAQRTLRGVTTPRDGLTYPPRQRINRACLVGRRREQSGAHREKGEQAKAIGEALWSMPSAVSEEESRASSYLIRYARFASANGTVHLARCRATASGSVHCSPWCWPAHEQHTYASSLIQLSCDSHPTFVPNRPNTRQTRRGLKYSSTTHRSVYALAMVCESLRLAHLRTLGPLPVDQGTQQDAYFPCGKSLSRACVSYLLQRPSCTSRSDPLHLRYTALALLILTIDSSRTLLHAQHDHTVYDMSCIQRTAPSACSLSLGYLQFKLALVLIMPFHTRQL